MEFWRVFMGGTRMNTKRERKGFASHRGNQQTLKKEENSFFLHNTKALSFSNGDFLEKRKWVENEKFLLWDISKYKGLWEVFSDSLESLYLHLGFY